MGGKRLSKERKQLIAAVLVHTFFFAQFLSYSFVKGLFILIGLATAYMIWETAKDKNDSEGK